jgi:uncharacterized protein YceK
MRTLTLIIILLLVPSLTGCYSIIGRVESGFGVDLVTFPGKLPFAYRGVYPGIQYSAAISEQTFGSPIPNKQMAMTGSIVVGGIDFWFSSVLDTILLPLDLIWWAVTDDEPEAPSEEGTRERP